MVRTIVYISMDADYRESSQDTSLHSLFDTLTYRRDVFLRNRSSDYSRLELECFFSIDIHWLEFYLTVSVLSTSTGLFCVLAVHIHSLGKCFFVCNLRSTYICFHLELTQQSVYDDLKMQLSHSGNDRLACFMVSVCTEGRVFFCKFCKRLSKFALGSLCLRLDRQLDNRFRELHGLQDNRMLLVWIVSPVVENLN